MGEACNRYRAAEAIEWIRTHPSDFLMLTSRRILAFWFIRGWPIHKMLLTSELTLMAFYALYLAIHRRTEAGWLLGILWLTYPLIHYLLLITSRYRCPLDWSILLLEVYALTAWRDAVNRSFRTSKPPSAEWVGQH